MLMVFLVENLNDIVATNHMLVTVVTQDKSNRQVFEVSLYAIGLADEPLIIEVLEGDYVELPNLEGNGFKILGFYLEETYTTLYDFEKQVTQSFNLYLKYERYKDIVISYDYVKTQNIVHQHTYGPFVVDIHGDVYALMEQQYFKIPKELIIYDYVPMFSFIESYGIFW